MRAPKGPDPSPRRGEGGRVSDRERGRERYENRADFRESQDFHAPHPASLRSLPSPRRGEGTPLCGSATVDWSLPASSDSDAAAPFDEDFTIVENQLLITIEVQSSTLDSLFTRF